MDLRFKVVRIPLLVPFKTSFGTQYAREAILLILRNEGITAYSECVADVDPYYSYEDNETALHIISDFLVQFIEDLPDPDTFCKRARQIRGHNMAKAAVEMLLWDYAAKKKEVPLHSMLGKGRGFAETGISIGLDSPAKMVKRVEAAVETGYRRIKVKIEKGMDLEVLSAIRDRFPDIRLSADANSCYTLSDVETLRKMDKYELVYIEQPLEHDDLVHHAKLSAMISTPVCLDESITDPGKAEDAFEMGACSVVNIKPGRVGGMGPSLKIASIAREHGGHCWIGGMLETGIGRCFNVSLASLEAVDYPGDTSPNERYFAKDIVLNPFRMEKGVITPNNGNGIGAEVDEKLLESYTVRNGLLLLR
ncbi:MAG: o-succinylbenzoate synthase [Methanomassiliicoccales archaeon]